MIFLDLVKQRRSVRKFLSKPIERELIEQCIEAARLAPSACNAQPWKFVVIDEPTLKDKVAKETYGLLDSFNKFTQQAPVIVVIVAENPNITSRMGTLMKNIEFPLIDIGITAEHFCLQATELGLGTCMIGWFKEKPIKELLNIPKQRKIALMISVGFPYEDKSIPKKRKDLSSICTFNKYE